MPSAANTTTVDAGYDMATGIASEIGPDASAANRHMVASAMPAPAAMASQIVGAPKAGNGPETANARVSKMKPDRVTPAVVCT